MKQNQLYLINQLRSRIKKLEILAREPQNYKEKCDEMEKRIEALEKSVKEILYVIGR